MSARDRLIFFPEDSRANTQERVARAKAYCARCKVRSDCLMTAIEQRIDYGIFGGMTADERAYMRPMRKVAA